MAMAPCSEAVIGSPEPRSARNLAAGPSPSSLCGSPASGGASCASPRQKARAAGINPGEMSPRLRKSLTSGYERANGTALFQEVDSTTGSPQSPRQAKRNGVKEFTDPRNPFSRVASKQISRVEEARAEKDRAGRQTRNPGVMPIEESHERPRLGEAHRLEEGRLRVVPHRYGNNDWKPTKKATSGPEGSVPSSTWMRNGSGARPDTGSAPGILENYLNDMKKSKCSRAAPQMQVPTPCYQRMNEAKTRLPSDRERARSLSRGPASEQASLGDVSVQDNSRIGSRARSVSQARNPDEAEHGFIRKRPVDGNWTHNSGRKDLLHHAESDALTPRTPRNTRAHQANERMEEIVDHIKAQGHEVRAQFTAVKARNEGVAGLLTSEQAVLHKPSERKPKLGSASPRSWGGSVCVSPRFANSAPERSPEMPGSY